MKYFYLLLFCTFFCSLLQAQQIKLEIKETTIVRDLSGTVYPYAVWRALLMQGDYDIKPNDLQNQKTDFMLVKLTEEQKNRRLERLPKPKESEYFKTGSEFATFKTSDINKRKIDLKAERGKIFVINFWFINCQPCQKEIPALNELVATFKGTDNVRFIAIALDDKYSVSSFLKNFPFNYNIVGDGRYFAERYKVRSYPTHVIVDQEGKVYFHTTGLALNTVHWLKKSIHELLSKSPVANK